MADYAKKTQTENSHLANQTSARFKNYTASGTDLLHSGGCRLLRVVLNTNGGICELRDGSRVIGIIASDAPEGTFNYGVYCENNLTVDNGGSNDVTVVFDV